VGKSPLEWRPRSLGHEEITPVVLHWPNLGWDYGNSTAGGPRTQGAWMFGSFACSTDWRGGDLRRPEIDGAAARRGWMCGSGRALMRVRRRFPFVTNNRLEKND
jgi:hypothetical protein